MTSILNMNEDELRDKIRDMRKQAKKAAIKSTKALIGDAVNQLSDIDLRHIADSKDTGACRSRIRAALLKREQSS